MVNWARFYATYPATFARTEYLKQVGHTEQGKPLDAEKFELMLAHITSLLDLQSTDRLLDLCCGNGRITHELARRCRRVDGVDFSEPLLDIAREAHLATNIEYHCLDVLNVTRSRLGDVGFDKVLMFGALQHLHPRQLSPLLQNLIALTDDSNRTIVLGHVPDRQKKWLLHDSMSKKFKYLLRKVTNRDLMGTWWDKEYIARVAEQIGLRCTFHVIDSKLHAARYRMDIRLQ